MKIPLLCLVLSGGLTCRFEAAPTSFDGNIVLGCPTTSAVKASIFSTDQNGSITLSYGTSSGTYTNQTPTGVIASGVPLLLNLSGLSVDTQYYYRLDFQAAGESEFSHSDEHTFHTARTAGSPFTFTLQADSHMDVESDLNIYRQTLANVAAGTPDFHIDLGDTFMCEKHSAPLTAVVQPAADAATVDARYIYERTNFGLITHSVPLFLVNGNHEGEAGWLNDGSSNNLAIWTTQARRRLFLNPIPDTYYGGDTYQEPIVGERASWYAWQWGNALFVVLDPYWKTPIPASNDPWNMTLGDRQYQWLQQTLANTTATFKFIFVHNLVGGLDGQMRGGIEAAPFYEWGGLNTDGTPGFTTKRPGWAIPIHQVLVQHGVTAVFHGHDHLYAKQQLDGIIYQEVPQPSCMNSQNGPVLATDYHYANGTILSSSGHLRVTVNADHATSQYVRTWLPANETATRKNGQIDDTWSVGAPGWPTASFTFTPTAPIGSQAVVFTDTSTGNPTAWSWNFGDGATSSLQNPSHIYQTANTYTVSLTVSNTTGAHAFSRTLTVTPNVAPDFTFSPSAPLAGQTVVFTDTTTGNPTTWSWNFGDGQKSALQNPNHIYSAAGTYTVTLKASNATGSKSVKRMLTVGQAPGITDFTGNIVLGCPTESSIKANIFTPNQSGSFYLAYGTASGTYDTQTTINTLDAATPTELSLSGLSPDTRYYYQLYFRSTGETSFTHTVEYTFHTARPAGSTFTFSIQGDSHPERANTQFDPSLYARTLQTAAADNPDFYLTIGDDFSVDNLDPATVTAAQVTERYTIQRPYLGLIGRSSPVFLVNGNHEQAARYLLDGTPDNVAVWAQNARNSHFPQPSPDGFYTGNPEVIPYIGLLKNHYAWTWGDALFVVIDPYWASPTCVDDPFDGGPKRTNLWDITHGDAQYQWLKTTLEQNHSKFKFVFAHHVLGTGRGGIELAGSYEWGGNNNNGTPGFAGNRPAWAAPIHQLMAANHVSVFFQGHDHIWARQQLDGVTYQTLPEPADPNYSLFNNDAFLTGDKFPNTGYTRVNVAPFKVTVDYVRTWLPADEGSGRISGSTVFSYTLHPPGETVGDGIPDWWRAQYFGGDGTTTNAYSAATGDPDHDGVDNLHEYLADTNPSDARSCFQILSVAKSSGFAVHFQSSAERKYTLYSTTDLTSGTWTAIQSQSNIGGSGGVDTLADPAPPSTRCFYRVGVQLP